jgi:hypothetical protein
MRFPGNRLVAALCFTAGIALTPFAQAEEGTVIISRDCDYILLDSSQGQVLIKLIQGERPKPGDKLNGNIDRGFNELTNRRTGDVMQVWVDMVDRGRTRALMRYGQYCN